MRNKIIFLAIGVLNTLIDISIYGLLVQLHMLPMVFANFVSTSAGISSSFYFNRRFTFQHKPKTGKRTFVVFFAITAFGLWVLQPIIITIVSNLIKDEAWSTPTLVSVFLPKLVATAVTLVWNYTFYDKVVFKP